MGTGLLFGHCRPPPCKEGAVRPHFKREKNDGNNFIGSMYFCDHLGGTYVFKTFS